MADRRGNYDGIVKIGGKKKRKRSTMRREGWKEGEMMKDKR